MASFLLKPGSIAVIIVSTVLVGGMFLWAEDTIGNTSEESFQQQNDALQCSRLDVDFVSQQSNGTHTTVFIQTNSEIPELAVEFKGKRNITKTITDLGNNELKRVSAPLNDTDEISAYIKGCARSFE